MGLTTVSDSMLGFEGGAYSQRNKIIGGDFTTNPWQRGTSFPALASGSYFADRWQTVSVTSALVTASKATDAPTAAQAGVFTQHCASLAVTTADTTIASGDVHLLLQPIEGFNAVSFGFGQAGSRNVTLSFWVKGTKVGIHCVSVRNASGATRSYVAEYAIIASNTWEYKTITIPVDTVGAWLYDTGSGLHLSFALMAGSTYQTTANTWAAGNFVATANQVNALDAIGNTFKIALVQLEAGSVATPFETRMVDDVLRQCQRYYEEGSIKVYADGATAIAAAQNYKTVKRDTPTLSFAVAAGRRVLPTSVEWNELSSFGAIRTSSDELAATWNSSCEL